jgi:hypothetical protein
MVHHTVPADASGLPSGGASGDTANGFYRYALTAANETGIEFLVGGAAAFWRYTGILRDTKDLDLFVRPHDAAPFLGAFAQRGHDTDLTFPHWLGKVFAGEHFLDVIFGSGNGVAEVDDEWFEYAEPDELWGVPVRLAPVEEMIWSKAYIQERERYDGADIAHLLLARGDRLNWPRLLNRFGDHWRVLLAHLVLYGFVYPAAADRVPAWVLEDLTGRLPRRTDPPLPPTSPPSQSAGPPLCRGTLLSREQYLIDIEEWHFADARLPGHGGNLSTRDIAHWTAAINNGEPRPS